MKLVLSGMEDSFYHGRPNGWYDSFAEVARVTPEAFFNSADVTHSRNHLDTKVWVYSAPWNFLSTQDDKNTILLEQWLKHSNRALALKREGIKVEIVNVQAVSIYSFCNAIGIEPPCKFEPAVDTFTTNEETIALFKKWSPDIWVTYEKLEAASWTIYEAITHAGENSPIVSQIINTLANVQRKAYVTFNEQSELTVGRDERIDGLYKNSLEVTPREIDIDDLVAERVSELSTTLEQAKQDFSREKTKTQKALALNQTLEKDISNLKIEHIKTTSESDRLHEENELLVEKLYQVQVELESYYKDKVALENALIESKVILDRVRTTISSIVRND